MEKVQVIPPPKDVDPQVLAWKGAAVLGKMDAASELWVTRADWVYRLLILISSTTNKNLGLAGNESP